MPPTMTTTIPVHYNRLHVADVDAAGWHLRPPLAGRPWHDPEVRFVEGMCAFAQLVLTHQVEPYYTDSLAAAVVRAAMVPAELAERGVADPDAAAELLDLPARELTPAALAQALPLYPTAR